MKIPESARVGESGADDVPLHALGGRSAPFDARFDLKEALLLPELGRAPFLQLLAAGLAESPAAELQSRAQEYCQQFDVPPGRITRLLRVCRLLFREAARRAVAPATLAADMTKLLVDDAAPAIALLLPAYEMLLPQLRRECIYGALTDHGNLLVGVDWRIDQMKLSRRGVTDPATVALVTLSYRNGKREERLTLQALPDMIKQLRSLCDALEATSE